jgi:hypothetical protein
MSATTDFPDLFPTASTCGWGLEYETHDGVWSDLDSLAPHLNAVQTPSFCVACIAAGSFFVLCRAALLVLQVRRLGEMLTSDFEFSELKINIGVLTRFDC